MSTSALQKSQRSATHELTPNADCAERARQAFVFHAKREIGRLTRSGLSQVRSAESAEALTKQLQKTSSYAVWTSLNQATQRQMWRVLDEMVARQSHALQEKAREIDSREKLGSLHLDQNFRTPEYLEKTAYHGQPGGYVATRDAADLHAGLLQEAGGTLYTRGAGTGANDSKAQAVVDFLGERFPTFAPRRILDLGCGFGGQTCGYAAAFPEAEVHGVDVGSAALRFGHLRAESLEVAVHFHQMDATATTFDDASFDLVLSNILLHEIPAATLSAVMAECHRLVRSGGVTVHQDVPTQRPGMQPFDRVLSNWQTRHNDEPYWETFSSASVPDELASAGFEADKIFEDYIAQVDGPLVWYFVGASK